MNLTDKARRGSWEAMETLFDGTKTSVMHLCRVLLGPNGDIAYTDRICCILRDYFLYDFLSQFRPGDRQRLNHFCSFIVSGNLNLALSWLRDGGQESPDEMARLAGSIIMGGVSALGAPSL